MMEVFNYFESVSKATAWAVFSAVVLLFVLIPIGPLMGRAIRVFLSKEQPEIRDFSWRRIPNYKLAEDENRTLYLQSEKDSQCLQGTRLMLNWEVIGAFRVDILPIKKRISGNAALVTVQPFNRHFKLIAYTWKGKLSKELIIPSNAVFALNSMNLSHDASFGQTATSWSKTPLSEAHKTSNNSWKTTKLRWQGALPGTSLSASSSRDQFSGPFKVNTRQLSREPLSHFDFTRWSHRFQSPPPAPMKLFNPSAYTQAIRGQEINHSETNAFKRDE